MNELERLYQEVNRIDINPRQAMGQRMSTWQPSLDIYQTDTEISGHHRNPGINPKDIDITVGKNMLSVKES